MKKRVALIGLGRISCEYYKGITSSKTFDLVAVCDINEEAVGRLLYNAFPYYKNIDELLSLVDFDAAMKRQQLYKTEEGRAMLKLQEGDTHHGGCGHCNG